jgi:hypothetical protein
MADDRKQMADIANSVRLIAQNQFGMSFGCSGGVYHRPQGL